MIFKFASRAADVARASRASDCAQPSRIPVAIDRFRAVRYVAGPADFSARPMPSLIQITTAPHLTFDALVAGDDGAPLVLLLHGFAESMHCWRAQIAALADMGYRALAPSQRGYSPGARPDTRDFPSYHIDRLMDDAMAIAAAQRHGDGRFHLAGHDWGGSIAWALADRYPERIASLTILSRPHPNAFNRALEMDAE